MNQFELNEKVWVEARVKERHDNFTLIEISGSSLLISNNDLYKAPKILPNTPRKKELFFDQIIVDGTVYKPATFANFECSNDGINYETPLNEDHLRTFKHIRRVIRNNETLEVNCYINTK